MEVRTNSARHEVLRRREELGEVLDDLERALLDEPDDIETWRGNVRVAVDALHRQFVRHIEITEEPGGLYDEVLEIAPEHARSIDSLRNDHGEIAAELEALRLDVAVEAATEHIVAIGQQLLDHLATHRQRGADLVWRAYQTDLFGGE